MHPLHLLMAEPQPPAVLIIHLGKSDFGDCTVLNVRLRRQTEMELITHLWPHTRLVWSEMLTRQVWQGAIEPASSNKVQKNVNCEVPRIILGMGVGGWLHIGISAKMVQRSILSSLRRTQCICSMLGLNFGSMTLGIGSACPC